MAELIDFEPEPRTSTTLRDQRRPGRREANPTLIPLLRGQAPPIAEPAVETLAPGDVCVEPDRRATLSAARGICLGVALGALIWGSIGAGFWYYFSG